MSQSWDSYSGGGSPHVEVGTKIIAKLESLRTLHSGDTEPAATVARMLWADTATKLLKQRNAENTDWVAIGSLCAPNHRMVVPIRVGEVSASGNVYLVPAPHAMTVESVRLLVYAAVAADLTDFWTFQLRNVTQAEDLLSAAVTTETTGLDADTPFDLEPDQNGAISEDDVLELQIVKAASAADLENLTAFLVGYPTGA